MTDKQNEKIMEHFKKLSVIGEAGFPSKIHAETYNKETIIFEMDEKLSDDSDYILIETMKAYNKLPRVIKENRQIKLDGLI